MTYTIWTKNGESHPDFTVHSEALEYARKNVLAYSYPALGGDSIESPEIYTSDWFSMEDGGVEYDAQCCYVTREAMDADQDGAYAPKIERRNDAA